MNRQVIEKKREDVVCACRRVLDRRNYRLAFAVTFRERSGRQGDSGVLEG